MCAYVCTSYCVFLHVLGTLVGPNDFRGIPLPLFCLFRFWFFFFGFFFKSVFYRHESREELEKLLVLSESVRGYHFYHIRSAQNSLLHRQPDIAKRYAGRYGHARVHAALRLWGENDLRYLPTCVHSLTLYNNNV